MWHGTQTGSWLEYLTVSFSFTNSQRARTHRDMNVTEYVSVQIADWFVYFNFCLEGEIAGCSSRDGSAFAATGHSGSCCCSR